MKITRSIKLNEIKKEWVLIDATDVRLGKLASKVASILIGKEKTNSADHLDCGNNVIIINASKVSVNPRALNQKKYYSHSGYIGGLKEQELSELIVTRPEFVIRKAIWGMLPKNKLGRKILSNVRIFKDENHNLQAQNPKLINIK